MMTKTNSAQRLAIDIELIAGNLAAVDSTGAVIGAEFRLGSPVDPRRFVAFEKLTLRNVSAIGSIAWLGKHREFCPVDPWQR
jgi:hypothetical protein